MHIFKNTQGVITNAVFHCLLLLSFVHCTILGDELNGTSNGTTTSPNCSDCNRALYEYLKNNSEKNTGPWRNKSDNVAVKTFFTFYSIKNLVSVYDVQLVLWFMQNTRDETLEYTQTVKMVWSLYHFDHFSKNFLFAGVGGQSLHLGTWSLWWFGRPDDKLVTPRVKSRWILQWETGVKSKTGSVIYKSLSFRVDSRIWPFCAKTSGGQTYLARTGLVTFNHHISH
jgi:hypothetical protein